MIILIEQLLRLIATIMMENWQKFSLKNQVTQVKMDK